MSHHRPKSESGPLRKRERTLDIVFWKEPHKGALAFKGYFMSVKRRGKVSKRESFLCVLFEKRLFQSLNTCIFEKETQRLATLAKSKRWRRFACTSSRVNETSSAIAYVRSRKRRNQSKLSLSLVRGGVDFIHHHHSLERERAL